MWQLSAHWWEFVLRGTIVYVVLLLLLRTTGKRQAGQLAPFDLVLLLIISNAVQNAMNGGDNSVSAGIILAVTLIGLNALVARLTYKSPKLEALLEGRPEVLVFNGHVFQKVMDHQCISALELETAIRNAGCETIAEVHLAILENNGHVSVLPKKAEEK